MKFLYYSPLIVASIDIFISVCYTVLKDWPRANRRKSPICAPAISENGRILNIVSATYPFVRAKLDALRTCRKGHRGIQIAVITP